MLTFGHDLAQHEYHAVIDGQRAGLVSYRRNGRVITITHTETMPEFSGRGVASQLMKFVLDDVRASAYRVRPDCTYAAQWIDTHDDYRNLLDDGHELDEPGPLPLA